MMFTISDVSSFSTSLSRWELAEYASEALVVLACVGEYIADLTEWKTKEFREHVGRFSTIVLIAALAGELACLVKTNELSGMVIGSLGDKAAEADRKARKAVEDSITALTKSGIALSTSAVAEEDSTHAVTVASGARKEANEVATEVNGVQATISARRVTDEEGLEEDLKNEFRGRRIVFKSYAALSEDEPFWLCVQLLEIARKAEVEPIDKCATEPVKNVPISNIMIDAPTIEEGQRLSMVLKKQSVLNGFTVGRVTGYGVTLRGGMPEVAVLIGIRPSVPMYPWGKPNKAPSKSKVKP